MEKRRYQVQRIKIPKNAGTKFYTDFELTLDRSYDQCVGIETYEQSGQDEQYQIGIRDENQSYIDSVPKQSLLSTINVPQDGKLKSLYIPIVENRQVSISFRQEEDNVEEINFSILFLLTAEQKQVA